MTKSQAAESITVLVPGYSTMTDAQKADAIEAVTKLAGMVDDEPAPAATAPPARRRRPT